jgi:ABC-type sugar transport system ATPase subunit
MNAGIVQQIGTPAELYRRPANLFVAGFIGSPKINMLTGMATGGGFDVEGVGTIPATSRHEGAGTLAFRPGDVHLRAEDPKNVLRGEIVGTEYLGNLSYIRVALATGSVIAVEERPNHGWALGQRVSADLASGAIHLFDAEGDRVDFETTQSLH